ncbi:amino acid ABC transporter ATP-binding protein [Streptomyces avidinii]|uniref:amino acid ABC transporter ATP-binding protein n=1 Tax=Streptomyces avidinii TaxID=1895 RepID=UPI00378D5A3B
MVEVRGVHKSFGPLEVLCGVDLLVRAGEVTVILGPSGSGKSTLLRTINHLEKVSVLHRPRQEAEATARRLLDRVGLADKADAYPLQLSGGQQQRVAIARALALEPKVLLFDEPTSALDPELVGEVLDVIKDLARAGTTMIVVTHEIGFAREVADTVVFMDGGAVVEQEPPAAVLDDSQHVRTRAFLSKVL